MNDHEQEQEKKAERNGCLYMALLFLFDFVMAILLIGKLRSKNDSR